MQQHNIYTYVQQYIQIMYKSQNMYKGAAKLSVEYAAQQPMGPTGADTEPL